MARETHTYNTNCTYSAKTRLAYERLASAIYIARQVCFVDVLNVRFGTMTPTLFVVENKGDLSSCPIEDNKIFRLYEQSRKNKRVKTIKHYINGWKKNVNLRYLLRLCNNRDTFFIDVLRTAVLKKLIDILEIFFLNIYFLIESRHFNSRALFDRDVIEIRWLFMQLYRYKYIVIHHEIK